MRSFQVILSFLYFLKNRKILNFFLNHQCYFTSILNEIKKVQKHTEMGSYNVSPAKFLMPRSDYWKWCTLLWIHRMICLVKICTGTSRQKWRVLSLHQDSRFLQDRNKKKFRLTILGLIVGFIVAACIYSTFFIALCMVREPLLVCFLKRN